MESDIVHHLCPPKCVVNKDQHWVCFQQAWPVRHSAGILPSLKAYFLLHQQGVVESMVSLDGRHLGRKPCLQMESRRYVSLTWRTPQAKPGSGNAQATAGCIWPVLAWAQTSQSTESNLCFSQVESEMDLVGRNEHVSIG